MQAKTNHPVTKPHTVEESRQGISRDCIPADILMQSADFRRCYSDRLLPMFLRTLDRHWIPLVLTLLAATLFIQLFVPPQLGLADQGDFARVLDMWRLDYPQDIPVAARPWRYWFTTYVVRKPHGLSVPFTTEHLFGAVAFGLNALCPGRQTFDIRLLGLIHYVALLAATFFVLAQFRKASATTRCVLSAAVLVILTDNGYVPYLNSWFAEPASEIFCLLWIGSVLRFLGIKNVRLIDGLLVAFTAALLVGAKTQNLILSVPIILLGFVICRSRLIPTVSTVVIGLFGVWSYLHAPDVRANTYDVVFSSILPTSPQPKLDLSELHLNPNLVSQTNTTAYTPGSAYYDPSRFTPRTNMATLGIFFVHHPARVARIIERYWPYARANRLLYLGQYAYNSGMRPKSQSPNFCFWDAFRHWLPWPLVLLVLIGGMLAPLFPSTRPTSWLVCALSTSSTLAGFVAFLADSNEVQKHMFLARFLWDCTLVGCLLGIIHILESRREHQN